MQKYFINLFLLSIFTISNSFSQQTLTLRPGSEDGIDAYLHSMYPDQNRGDYTNLFALAWTAYGDWFISRSVFQFDLSSISPDAEILEAKLDLYYANNAGNQQQLYGNNYTYLERVIEPWDEYTVTWNNAPSTTIQNRVLLPTSTFPTQNYEDIDVTTIIQDMVSDPENSFGFLMHLGNEDPLTSMMFASSDYEDSTLRPRLRITFIGCLLPESQFDYIISEDSVFFTDQSSSADSWLWDFGDGNTSTEQNPAHHYMEEGSYSVCLTVTDSCGTDVHCEEVIYCENAPLVDFGYEAQGTFVNFHDSSFMASSWWWSFGDGYYSNLQNPVHQYELSGEYLVCLTAENSCGSATWCDTVNVCGSPETYFSYVIDDLEVFFTDLSNEASTWWWDFGDGYFSDLQNPIHIYDELGTYEVCLTATNECGEETYCETLFLFSVGINDAGTTSVEVFPNPAKGQVYVRSGIQDEFKYSLITLEGRIVKEGLLNLSPGNTGKIDLLNIQPGIFILRFSSEIASGNMKLLVQ